MTVAYKQHLFTVEEYHAMERAGILTEDDRVKLIEGQIVAVSPIGRRHAACVDRLTQLLVQKVGSSAITRVQNPIQLDDRSEAQPDVALLRPRSDFYAEQHPQANDVLLIVEVAEMSVTNDREIKLPLYARSGIPEVWLVVLEDDLVEIYRHPSSGEYEEQSRLERGHTLHVEPVDVSLPVDDVLGEPI